MTKPKMISTVIVIFDPLLLQPEKKVNVGCISCIYASLSTSYLLSSAAVW